MDRDILESTISSLKNREPFRPFVVELVNGDRVTVDRSDAVGVREGLAVYLGPDKIPHVFYNEDVSRIIGDLS